ncbi:UNVERIFIED_CONTAM: hypothetical protein FKN15_044101 [Acipenser sinensis]
MDRNALAELLQALESRRDAEERRREERYTALIERVGLAVAAATTPTTTPKTNKERRTAKWEGALVRQGWGLVGECCNGNKRQSKGVGTQCDREGEVTGPTRAEVIPAPLNVPDPWYSSADLVWGQKNDPSLVHAWRQDGPLFLPPPPEGDGPPFLPPPPERDGPPFPSLPLEVPPLLLLLEGPSSLPAFMFLEGPGPPLLKKAWGEPTSTPPTTAR